MKKVCAVLILLLIPAFSCFAGSFYSNIVVLSVESEKLIPVLLQMGITAYYVIKDRIGVIFEEKIDEQDIEYGAGLTSVLSKKLNTTAIYTTNHDSDVLYINIYKNGQEIFSYDSAPDYFEGGDTPPVISDIDKFLSEYENIDKQDFLNVLNSEEVFADDLHYKIAEKLSLPVYSVGLGYNFLSEAGEEEIRELENEYSIKVEQIGISN